VCSFDQLEFFETTSRLAESRLNPCGRGEANTRANPKPVRGSSGLWGSREETQRRAVSRAYVGGCGQSARAWRSAQHPLGW